MVYLKVASLGIGFDKKLFEDKLHYFSVGYTSSNISYYYKTRKGVHIVLYWQKTYDQGGYLPVNPMKYCTKAC